MDERGRPDVLTYRGRSRRDPRQSAFPLSAKSTLIVGDAMTISKFSGYIQTRPERRVPKLWEVHHDTGAYTQGETTYHSKVSLWVPTPRTGAHLPGIFIRLSNPAGRAFARLSPEEFSNLYSFFRTYLTEATEALAEATKLSEIYSSAERALWLESKNAKLLWDQSH